MILQMPKKNLPSVSNIDSHWAEKYIEALVDAGIIDPADYPDGFKPDAQIIRAEIIKLLVRIVGLDDVAKKTRDTVGIKIRQTSKMMTKAM